MKEGRKLFTELSAEDRRARRREIVHLTVACLLVATSWGMAIELAEHQQDQLDEARAEARLQERASAKAEAQRAVQDFWVPRVAEAYARGARDECERQRIVNGSQLFCGGQ